MVEVAIGTVGTILTAISIGSELMKKIKYVKNKIKLQEALEDEVQHSVILADLLKRQLIPGPAERNENFQSYLQNWKNTFTDSLELCQKDSPSKARIQQWNRYSKELEAKLSALNLAKKKLLEFCQISGFINSEFQSQKSTQIHDIWDVLEGDEEVRNMKRRLEWKKLACDTTLSLTPEHFQSKIFMCQGQWGSLYKARMDDREVVIKSIDDARNQDLINNFTREATYLVKNWHGYVVKLFGFCDQPDNKFLVYEYMQNGYLCNVLHGPDRHEALSNHNLRLRMALDVCMAIWQVNSVSMLYESLCSSKFLVDKDYYVKISDMQFAKTFSSCARCTTTDLERDVVSLDFYRCPERFHRPCPYTVKSQIYCLGIILWEVLSRSMPFKELGCYPHKTKVMRYVEAGNQETLPNDKRLNKLVQSCRNVDPNKRPDLKDIIQVLNSVNADAERRDYYDC